MNDTSSMIGRFLPPDVERDAIHVAVLPVTAAQLLDPGQWVYLDEKGCAAANMPGETPLGIIDPFLFRQVVPGERIFVFLQPKTVTGMRHHWTHPAVDPVDHVPAATAAFDAAAVLRKFAQKWGMGLDDLMTAKDPGAILVAIDHDLHSEGDFAPGELELFWRAMEAVSSRTFSAEHRTSIVWSCSC